MKKTTAGAGLAAAIGFSALTATPAMAVPYESCSAAEASEVYNIPVGDPRYGEHLDSDLDGVGCENANYGPAVPPDTTVVGDPADMFDSPVAPLQGAPGDSVAEQPQVTEMPVGAVDAGVPVEKSPNPGIVALAGGLALAGLAGATVVARRSYAKA